MENKGLLFIPDISGFTRFVNDTDIEHSRLIIQELLEVLINANQINLQISEIEGDAILFYKFGALPDVKELYAQVEKMFCAFHSQLNSYEVRRFCQCKACRSAINLTLKVITHYGEFTGYNVKTFNKLIGKDIIVAHQLLKNDIEQHEYWLVTKNLVHGHPPDNLAEWMQWNSSAKQTDTGEIAFHYTQLSHLKEEIPPESIPEPDLSKMEKIMSVSKEYDTSLVNLFHATGDFNYRSEWYEGVKTVEAIDHFLPRVGMRCRCTLTDGKSETIYASSYVYRPGKIVFSETHENKDMVFYTLEVKDPGTTKLTLDFYAPKNLLNQLMFKLTKKPKMEASIKKSLQNLTEVIKHMHFTADEE
jgi:hypothetical protein